MRFMFLSLILLLLSVPAQAKILDIQEVTSESGITAWLVEDHSIPVIAMSFSFIDAGSKQDPEHLQGLTQLASNTMDEGAGELSAHAFQDVLNTLSITLRFASGRDQFSGRLKTLSRNKDKAFELLNLALTQPRFDEEAVERMRKANQSRIRSSLSDPQWVTARITNNVIYAGHPYALNSGGTLSTLDNITAENLRSFAQNRLALSNLRVAVAGDITAQELKTQLDRIFSGLPDTPQTMADIPDLELQNQGKTFVYQKDIPQTIMRIVQPGIDHDDPQYHAAQVFNYIFGGAGFGARLTEELREKRGLTYGIFSYLTDMDHTNSLTIQSSTKNENISEFLNLTRITAQNLIDQGVTQKELDDARTYLLGSMPLGLSSTDRIASFMLGLQENERPLNYLEEREEALNALQPQDIQNVAQRILSPADWTVILTGQPESISDAHMVEALPNVE